MRHVEPAVPPALQVRRDEDLGLVLGGVEAVALDEAGVDFLLVVVVLSFCGLQQPVEALALADLVENPVRPVELVQLFVLGGLVDADHAVGVVPGHEGVGLGLYQVVHAAVDDAQGVEVQVVRAWARDLAPGDLVILLLEDWGVPFPNVSRVSTQQSSTKLTIHKSRSIVSSVTLGPETDFLIMGLVLGESANQYSSSSALTHALAPPQTITRVCMQQASQRTPRTKSAQNATTPPPHALSNSGRA